MKVHLGLGNSNPIGRKLSQLAFWVKKIGVVIYINNGLFYGFGQDSYGVFSTD